MRITNSAPIESTFEERTSLQEERSHLVDQVDRIAHPILSNSSLENLRIAEDFLKENRSKNGVQSFQEGKLQYKIEKIGNGAVAVKKDAVIVHYALKLVDGTVFESSKDPVKILLPLTIPGFRDGVVGMKEGELRTLYIHPDLGYGTYGSSHGIRDNSLLIFEVELLKRERPLLTEQLSLVLFEKIGLIYNKCSTFFQHLLNG